MRRPIGAITIPGAPGTTLVAWTSANKATNSGKLCQGRQSEPGSSKRTSVPKPARFSRTQSRSSSRSTGP